MTDKQQKQPAGDPGVVEVQVVGAGGAASTTQITPVPSGVTVEELLSRKDPWMIAHRGGSRDWPEMSLKAYSESANRGIPALEFSFHFTADGVPVGVHDNGLKNVDPSASDTPVTKMTWEQVRQYTTKGEPFMRLQDLTAGFGQDHVLFVDPKASARPIEAYLPLLDPTHTILKYAGDATHLADPWREAGFKTWGFMYENSMLNGEAATWAPHWDLIGLNWDASEAAWEIARGLGRPIVGHICPSQEAINTCLQRGAVGVMCSKIDGMTLP